VSPDAPDVGSEGGESKKLFRKGLRKFAAGNIPEVFNDFRLEVLDDIPDVHNSLLFWFFVGVDEVQTFLEYLLCQHDFSAEFFLDTGKGFRRILEGFLVKEFRPEGKGFVVAWNELFNKIREWFQEEGEDDNNQEIAEEMAEGNLLGDTGREVFQKNDEPGQYSEAYQGAAALEYEVRYGAPFAVYIADHTAKQSRCSGAYIRAKEDGQGIIDGNEALLAKDDEYADGDCRSVDEGGKDNADEQADEGIFCFPKKMKEKRILFEGCRCVGDEI
jgi:hypothetical protein